MTGEEQIIIDGVDIIDCDYFYVEQETDQVKCDNYSGYCRQHKNCPFKQLARKTQECEELKGIISDFISDNSTMYCYDNRQPVTLEEIQECMEFTYNAGLKYKQTLEAIEKECKFVIDNRECYDLREADRCELILNLINKAKGEGNV